MNRQIKRRIIIVMVVLLAVLILVGVLRTCLTEASLLTVDTNEAQSQTATETDATEIMVHVAGAVVNPGLYTFKSGDRVADAIHAAGGFTEDADQDAVNLATRLEDEAKITIPSLSTDEDSSASSLVNINTADKETLMTLPGIGEVIAQNIIDYRTKNGAFANPEDLKNVNRIGDKLYEQIADLITL